MLRCDATFSLSAQTVLGRSWGHKLSTPKILIGCSSLTPALCILGNIMQYSL